MSHVVGRSFVIALLLTCTIAPVGAELKFTSRVEVTKLAPPDTFFSLVFVPVHRITPGTADITTYVAGDRVRVEGMGAVLGLAADTVLLTRADGATLFIQPSSGTFFIQTSLDALAMVPMLGTTVKTSRKGRSDTILAQRTERVIHEIRIRPKLTPSSQPLKADYQGKPTDALGRTVNEEAMGETAEQRQFYAARSDYRDRLDGTDAVMKIESWESAAFGRAAGVAAKSGAGPAAIASGGFSTLADLGFPLRQVLTYKGGGYQMETRVTSVSRASFDAALFEVPSGFKQVPPPPPAKVVR